MEQDLWVRDRAGVSEEARDAEEAAWVAHLPQDRAVFAYVPIADTRKVTERDNHAAAGAVRNAVR